ncbi:MAG: metal ABC transporter permease, partial [Patescibacteria group bacterium]
MNINFFISLITAVFIGGSAGYVGSLMTTKKMSLAGDVLSHIALPGVGLGLFFGLNVSLGALGSLVFGILLIWWLSLKTDLSMESLVGVVFVLSMAVGFLIIPEEDLLHALFGNISAVAFPDAVA